MITFMASKSFPKKIKIDKVRAVIKKHCVTIDYSNFIEFENKLLWCSQNVGVRRIQHPIFECFHGWVYENDVLGDWAYSPALTCEQWWFARKEDRLAFVLTFGG